MFELTGERALVTGAGDGMGVGIAHALARQGAAVAVNDLVAERAEETVKAITAAGGTAIAVPFDITSEEQVNDGIRRAEQTLGGNVSVLVNNAGVPQGMAVFPFLKMPREMWKRYVDLNIYGSLNCIAAVAPAMVDAGWGRIVQISSGAGRTGLNIGVSLYGASKSGIEGFVRHLSQELGRTGVTVNTVALGLMSNSGGSDERVTAGIARQVPVGRLGTPDDVGAAVVYLASREAAWVTGQTLNVNGGSTTN